MAMKTLKTAEKWLEEFPGYKALLLGANTGGTFIWKMGSEAPKGLWRMLGVID